MNTEKLIIGLNIISTGKYDVFINPLIDSLEKYFFTNNKVVLHLFWDKDYEIKTSERFSVIYIPTEHKPFPYPTLYRYKYFTNVADKIKCDYLFYLDVDMLLVDNVDIEILPDIDSGLVSVGHCGFWNGGGSWGQNINSKSFTPIEHRRRYYAGGFQGGKTEKYLAACLAMATDISDDESRNVLAEWHDETHWNKYLSTRESKMLTPSYCMVEEIELRKKWGITDFTPKIIALKKNHIEIRS